LVVSSKALFLTKLLQAGVDIPFAPGQAPGLVLGPKKESTLLGNLMDSTGALGEAVSIVLEATTLWVHAKGELLLTLEVKDIEAVRLVADLEPNGFLLQHAGLPMFHLLTCPSSGHRDALLDGLERRANLLGRSFEPFGAVDLADVSPVPRASPAAFSQDSYAPAFGAVSADAVAAAAAAVTHRFSARRVQVSGLARHGARFQAAARHGALGAPVELVVVAAAAGGGVRTLLVEVADQTQELAASGGRPTVVASRPLAQLVAVALPPTAKPTFVELQWAGGLCVAFELPTAADRGLFLACLADAGAACPLTSSSAMVGADGRGWMVVASQRLHALRAAPPLGEPLPRAESYFVSRFAAAAAEVAATLRRQRQAGEDVTVRAPIGASKDNNTSSSECIVPQPRRNNARPVYMHRISGSRKPRSQPQTVSSACPGRSHRCGATALNA
jgi:hypothetical protein